MTKTTRNDIHSPASKDFDPEQYFPILYVDFHPEDGNSREATKLIISMVAKGYTRGYGIGEHRCGHCGHHLRYAVIMVREDAKELILVGETCDENRFGLDKNEFRKLREAGRLNAERRTRREKMAKMYAEHPLLVDLTYLTNISELNWNDFLGDMYRALQGGWITDRQVDAACSAIERYSEKYWAREAEKAAKVKAGKVSRHIGTIGEKITLTGTVKFLFEGTAFHYYATNPWKYIIECEDGAIVTFSTTSTTMVDSLNGPKYGRGDAISFTGTVKAHTEYREAAQTLLTRVKAL
jgi:hypothetical protein